MNIIGFEHLVVVSCMQACLRVHAATLVVIILRTYFTVVVIVYVVHSFSFVDISAYQAIVLYSVC